MGKSSNEDRTAGPWEAEDTAELRRNAEEGATPGALAARVRALLSRLPRRAWVALLAAALLALALLGALLALTPGQESPSPQAAAEEELADAEEPDPEPSEPTEPSQDEEAPRSTPREQWHKGSMPYLYQIDPQWADVEYSGGRLAKQGCGPTALSMVYIYLTGNTDLDPVGMAAFATQNGYPTDGEGSYWTLMSEGAAKLGLSSRPAGVTEDEVRAELEAGRPVICVMAPGTFTEVGHFIVLERMAADGGVVVHDSNSRERSMRTWPLETICSEARAAWSFSAA